MKPGTDGASQPAALRWWLILLTLAALICSLASLGFGWAMNLDTELDVTPKADPAVRADAIGLRIFAWGGVALFILMLCSGLVGGWSAFRRRRLRPALAWSLLTAVPMLAVTALFLYFIVKAAQ